MPRGNRRWVLVVCGVVVGASLVVYLVRHRRGSPVTEMPAPASVGAAGVDPWKRAAGEVEEDRGEPTGRQAKVEVPAELKHYSDTKRFLGIQVAEWRKHRFTTPHDYPELAELIRSGELVELAPLGRSYIIYGVGLSASDEEFTHFDKKTRARVTLYGDEAGLRREYERIDASLKELEAANAEAREEARQTDKRERERLASLKSETAEREREADALRKRKKLLESYYGDRGRRQLLATEYESVAALAADFSGRRYDLNDPVSRKGLKVRMLSCLRPEALRVLEEIADAYRGKFGRPLPITSLVRPDEYQYLLSKVNPNATGIDIPPHSTGLAFDIYNHYMTAEEQDYVMAELARLEDEGRIETLRELRDHFHVFAFIDGRRPDESLIRQAISARAGEADEESTEKPESVTEGKRKDRETAATTKAAKKREAAQDGRAQKSANKGKRQESSAKARRAPAKERKQARGKRR